MNPLPYQQKVLTSDSPSITVDGGRGCGKTTLAKEWILQASGQIAVCVNDASQIHAIWDDIAASLKGRITFVTPQTVELLRGRKIDHLVIDQATIPSEKYGMVRLGAARILRLSDSSSGLIRVREESVYPSVFYAPDCRAT